MTGIGLDRFAARPKTAPIRVQCKLMERRSFILAALLGGALLAGAPSLALAQPQSRQAPPRGDIGEMLNLRPQDEDPRAPVAARYETESVGFTFDRSSPALRFDRASEIIVLSRRPEPRGGAMYVNDLGEPVLKVSGLGGMTLFTPDRPQGVPVRFVAVAPPLRLPPIGNAVMFGVRISEASRRATRVVQKLVVFEVRTDPTPETDEVYADAANLVAEAFEHVGRIDERRANARWRRVTQVELIEGAAPGAVLFEDTLRITVTPERGIAGRPSSARIARALR